jgi:hypothetical protein
MGGIETELAWIPATPMTMWRLGLRLCFPFLWLLAVVFHPMPALSTPASWDRVIGVDLPEFKKVAARHLSPEDAERLEKLTTGTGQPPVESDRVKPPYTPITNHSFDGWDFVRQIKPYIERGEVDRVRRFFEALNKGRLFLAWSEHFPARGKGYHGGYRGPSHVEFSIELADSKEYKIIKSFRPAAPRKGRTKDFGPRYSYTTGVYAR